MGRRGQRDHEVTLSPPPVRVRLLAHPVWKSDVDYLSVEVFTEKTNRERSDVVHEFRGCGAELQQALRNCEITKYAPAAPPAAGAGPKTCGSFSSASLVPLTNKQMKLTAGPGLRPKRQTTFVSGCKDLKTSIENDRILRSSALLVVSTSCRSCPATSSYDRNVVMKYTIRLVVTHLRNHQNRAGPGHR